MEAEDVDEIMQHYALCLPSEKISIRVLFPPYSVDVKGLLCQYGYSQIIGPNDKIGRAVCSGRMIINRTQPQSGM